MKTDTHMGMTPHKALQVFPQHNSSKLKMLRIVKGYSQQDLSRASGITKRSIQTYEQGTRSIDHAGLDTLCKLAVSLECKIENILESKELIALYRRCK